MTESQNHYLKAGDFNRLSRWSNKPAGFYGAAVFLVGSSLFRDDYRDIDIVIVIEDSDFEMRYGSIEKFREESETWMFTNISWSYFKDCLKRVRHGYKEVNLVLDVKIQSETFFKGYENMPKVRLDTSPFMQEYITKTIGQ